MIWVPDGRHLWLLTCRNVFCTHELELSSLCKQQSKVKTLDGIPRAILLRATISPLAEQEAQTVKL